MTAPSPIFSNYDYSDNKVFRDIVLPYYDFLEDNPPDDLRLERFGVLKYDLWQASRFWLEQFRDATWWRENLE